MKTAQGRTVSTYSDPSPTENGPCCIQEPGSNISEEIKKFAASYVQDILYKAISLAEEKFLAQESSKAREMAEQVVEEVITKAAETASEKLNQKMSPTVITPPSSLSFPGLPTIQIDTVASMPPSPTDWPEDKDEVEAQQQPEKRTQNQKVPGITIDEPEDDIGKIKLNLISYADAPQELREFAASYVKDIISRAISTADEKTLI